jgi:hypothetical protein
MKKKEMSGLPPGYLLLLPNWFRLLGIGMIGMALIIIVCGGEKSLPFSKSMDIWVMDVLFILGMLFVSSARRKIEDERSIYLRFQAISHAVVFTAIWYLLWPLIKMIWEPMAPLSGRAIVIVLLTSYLVSNIMWSLFPRIDNRYEKHDQSRKG